MIFYSVRIFMIYKKQLILPFRELIFAVIMFVSSEVVVGTRLASRAYKVNDRKCTIFFLIYLWTKEKKIQLLMKPFPILFSKVKAGLLISLVVRVWHLLPNLFHRTLKKINRIHFYSLQQTCVSTWILRNWWLYQKKNEKIHYGLDFV